MKNLLMTIMVVLAVVPAFSQQDPQFTQNMQNRLFPNPGVAGSNQAICATLFGREQWAGFGDGNPKTYLLSVHGPVPQLHGGVGLSVVSDQLGSEATTLLSLAYAYRKTIGVGSLGIGLGAGMVSKSLLGFTNDQALDGVSNDLVIQEVGQKSGSVDFDLGLYYKSDKLYLGFSSKHLAAPDLKSLNGYQIARNYYIMVGYDYRINPQFVLQPSVFTKSDGTSTQLDLNCNVMFNSQFFGGVTYRMGDAISPIVGVVKPIGPGTMKIGYSYDVTLSMLKSYSAGSHEIVLGYCFNVIATPKVTRHKTVRFL